MIRRFILAAMFSLVPHSGGLTAQTASLVADTIGIGADGALVAEGNVEVFFEGTRLTARQVRYDPSGETISVEGPLVLTQGEETIILASSAELDADLQNGILNSARLVLDRETQLAAARIDRAEGRYTRLSRVIASSCEVCEGEAPLWEIRATRVIHDEEARQLYFDNAQLRVGGVPVFYLPRLRLPDPTLRRTTGFLVPRLRSRSRLGTGFQFPYFITLGDHADLTFAPYISSETTTLGATYRHELRDGRVRLNGALSSDQLRPDSPRGFLFADGQFDLPQDFVLDFDLQLVSDDAYLFDYGITERDRLSSSVSASRIRDDQQIQVAATSFRTLRARDLEVERELPNELIDFGVEQRLFEDPVWGQAWAGFSGTTINRLSDDDEVGRDVSRLTASLGWTATQVFGPGIVAEGEARLDLDQYAVQEDSTLPDSGQRATPAVSVALSWPFARTESSGVRHLVEPKVQLAWSETSGDEAPNEDSTGVEFDEGNLFALSRFPGEDRRETGLRTNLGVTWTRYAPEGWSLGLTTGRVIRFDDETQFAFDTGLSGTASDWLVAGNVRIDSRLDLLTRTLFDDNLDISRSETRARWRDEKLTVAGTHIWRAADELEGRPDDLSEVTLDGLYRFDDFWSATADWRLDADVGETTRAGVGLRYSNECIAVDLSFSRRFTSSTNVEPVTDIDLRVSLTGFGSSERARTARRKCRG